MPSPLRYAGPTPSDARDVADLDSVYRVGNTFLPVANGSHFNGNWGGPSTNLIQTQCRQSRKLLRVIAGGADHLQVEWANIFTTTAAPGTDLSCEINGPNAVTVRMAIEYPAGTIRLTSGSSTWSSATAYVVGDQVVHSGQKYLATAASTNQTPSGTSAFWRVVNTYVINWREQTDSSGTVVFAPGVYRKSLPVKLSERVVFGDRIAVLGAFDSGGASNYIPYAGSNGAANHGRFVDWIVDAAGGLPAVGSSIVETGITNQTNGNATAANAADNQTWTKIPYATVITGNINSRRCVAIFGDSVAQGFGGDVRDGEPCGIFPRSLDGASWWRVAQGGNRAQNYTKTNAPWQFSVMRRCSAIICALGGLNDMMAGATAAQMKTYLERLWKALASTGAPVFTGLLTPISGSTDAWATTANQTRYTAGGTIPTTQFPTDADYASTVYGQTALWMSQDGGSIVDDAGVTVKAGQMGHPLLSILDWRSLMSDPATSWKWLPGFTTDGAHLAGSIVPSQVDLLVAQMEPVIMAREQLAHPLPNWNVSGEVASTVQSMSRSLAESLSTAASGTIATFVGTSPGRRYSQCRFWQGAKQVGAGLTYWTVLAGADPAKMKIIDSGSANWAANSLGTITFATPQYIPGGWGVVLVLTSPSADTRQYAGRTSIASGLHTSGSGFVMAGTSADVGAALTGTINMMTKFTVGTFRAWAELV